ncbi:MAG: hypothetical protein V1936_01695 [Patescibacteria group bacterium]
MPLSPDRIHPADPRLDHQPTATFELLPLAKPGGILRERIKIALALAGTGLDPKNVGTGPKSNLF